MNIVRNMMVRENGVMIDENLWRSTMMDFLISDETADQIIGYRDNKHIFINYMLADGIYNIIMDYVIDD